MRAMNDVEEWGPSDHCRLRTTSGVRQRAGAHDRPWYESAFNHTTPMVVNGVSPGRCPALATRAR